jgi:hypothetical protein
MTAEPTDTGVLNFKSPKRDAVGAVVPFTIDDDPTILTATRPKQAVLIDLYRKMDVVGEEDPAIIQVFDEFMRVCFDQETQDYLNSRFRDPDDDADIDTLQPVIETLMGVWYRRPTTKSSASSGPSRRSGPRSTGRRR